MCHILRRFAKEEGRCAHSAGISLTMESIFENRTVGIETSDQDESFPLVDAVFRIRGVLRRF